jgi:hypothetical protein
VSGPTYPDKIEDFICDDAVQASVTVLSEFISLGWRPQEPTEKQAQISFATR